MRHDLLQTMEVMVGRVWMRRMPDNLNWPTLTEHSANEMYIRYIQIEQIGDDFQRFFVLRPPDGNSRTFQRLVPTTEFFPLVIIRSYDLTLPDRPGYDSEKLRLLLKLTFKHVWVEGYRLPSSHGIGNNEEINFLSYEYENRSYSVDSPALQIQARMGGIKSTV